MANPLETIQIDRRALLLAGAGLGLAAMFASTDVMAQQPKAQPANASFPAAFSSVTEFEAYKAKMRRVLSVAGTKPATGIPAGMTELTYNVRAEQFFKMIDSLNRAPESQAMLNRLSEPFLMNYARYISGLDTTDLKLKTVNSFDEELFRTTMIKARAIPATDAIRSEAYEAKRRTSSLEQPKTLLGLLFGN